MFCKNCGVEYVTDKAVMCVKCGVKKGTGNNFCQNCGNAVQPGSVVCLTCGVSLENGSGIDGTKSKLVAALLALFLGTFGIHNFYLGYTTKAIIQLVLTIVGYMTMCLIIGFFIVLGVEIWAIVEAVLIFTGKNNTDAQGNLLAD